MPLYTRASSGESNGTESRCMETEHTKPAGPSGQPEYDELQRGQDTPPSTETLERTAPPHYGEAREVPIPDPGERPGAVRVDRAPGGHTGEPAAEETEEALGEARALLPPA
jgi:hypothetical protein